MHVSRAAAVEPARVITGCLLAAAMAAALMSLARPHDDLAGVLASFAAGLAFTPLLASLFEWLVHRHVYHRPAIPFLRRIFSIHQAHTTSSSPPGAMSRRPGGGLRTGIAFSSGTEGHGRDLAVAPAAHSVGGGVAGPRAERSRRAGSTPRGALCRRRNSMRTIAACG